MEERLINKSAFLSLFRASGDQGAFIDVYIDTLSAGQAGVLDDIVDSICRAYPWDPSKGSGETPRPRGRNNPYSSIRSFSKYLKAGRSAFTIFITGPGYGGRTGALINFSYKYRYDGLEEIPVFTPKWGKRWKND